MTRRCRVCKQEKSPDDFYARKSDVTLGRQWECKVCCGLRLRSAYRRTRGEILALLGGACACCGEAEPAYLQVDHVNGGGRLERQQNGNSIHALHRLVISNPSAYQVLCANCHSAKTLGQTCPHQTKD